ncbi:hypothetical protein GOBAR_AA14539 [Gossypium barbadense]|uniref:Uncharacterized protein n=1 Tax=Gossypium barbadense TaxID=3634 RepID=A0A2P5XS14_GOSBA|nr:hypothetical protein GOBAR_AA14539 [Gossypium barbadense]
MGPILLSTVSHMPLTRRILRRSLLMFPHSMRSLPPRYLGNDQFMQLLHWHIFPTDSPILSSGLVRAMSVPEFGVALRLYTDEFMEEEDMNALPRNIHISPSLCWKALAPLSSTYDPSRSKASALPLPYDISMPMIEHQHGTDPPQHRLSHAIDKEDLEEIPVNVPPQHEEPSTALPRERPVHAAASLAHLSD